MGPILALVIANVIWGAAPPIFKFAYENIPPFTLGFIRFTLASLILFPWVARAPVTNVRARDWIMLIAGSLFVSLHLGLFFLGLERTESINTSIISAVGPIFLYFASVRFLHERRNGNILVGMCIALAGSLTVIVSPLLLGHQSFRLGQFEGNLLILASTLTDMIAILFLKKALKHLSPLFVTLVMFTFSALLFYPLALWELQSWSFAQLDYRGVVGIIFGTLFSSTVAYYLHDYGISRVRGEEVGIFSYISPIVTILVAIPLLGEMPSIYFFGGGILVILGILIAERRFHWHAIHELRRQNP